jgi:hypothetical protein
VSLEGYPKHNVVKFLGDLEVVPNKCPKIAITRFADTDAIPCSKLSDIFTFIFHSSQTKSTGALQDHCMSKLIAL